MWKIQLKVSSWNFRFHISRQVPKTHLWMWMPLSMKLSEWSGLSINNIQYQHFNRALKSHETFMFVWFQKDAIQSGFLQGLKKSYFWKLDFKALKILKFWSKVLNFLKGLYFVIPSHKFKNWYIWFMTTEARLVR